MKFLNSSKVIGLTALSSVLMLGTSACQKMPELTTSSTPEASYEPQEIRPLDPQFNPATMCAMVYVTNLTYSHQYTLDGEPTGKYNEAWLNFSAAYNIYNHGSLTEPTFPYDLPYQLGGYYGPLPYAHETIPFNVTREFPIQYNPHFLGIIENASFRMPFEYQSYSNQSRSYPLLGGIPFSTTSPSKEGKCGWMTFYVFTNGGPGTELDPFLKTTPEESQKQEKYTVVQISHNVKQEVLAENVGKRALSSEELSVQIANRYLGYRKAVTQSLKDLGGISNIKDVVSVAKKADAVEFVKQASRADTSVQVAASIAVMKSNLNEQNIKLTPQFEGALRKFNQVYLKNLKD